MESLIIGGLAGAISRTLTAPIELLKIQQQNKFIPNTTLYDVIKNEGITGLWKGNFSNCIRIIPQMGINYSTYTNIKDTLENINSKSVYDNKKNIIPLISGGISGATAITLVYPLETVRSILSLQTCKEHYKGIINVLYKIPTKQLYNGLNMSLIGFVPYNALNFMFFNYYNNLFSDFFLEKDVKNRLCSGGLAGVSAVTITYPTDLIRRRLQIQGVFNNNDVPKYNGIKDCAKQIIKKEGVRGLYKGLNACYIKIFPANAIQFLVIGICNEYLKYT